MVLFVPLTYVLHLIPVSQVDGKLTCPKCAIRVGSFNWSGAQCSCKCKMDMYAYTVYKCDAGDNA